MKINNRDEIVNKLAEMMMDLEIERNPFQIDIYLYVDEKGNGELSQFTNVGGNSYINDDHITIYSSDAYCAGDDDMFYEYETIEEIAKIVELSADELIKQTAEYMGFDPDDVTIYIGDVENYIEHTDSLMKKIEEAYEDGVRENRDWFGQWAYDIIDNICEGKTKIIKGLY